MSNLICFTQDVPGEREWLTSIFPDYRCLETKSSGLWSTVTEDPVMWEVPCSDHTPVIDLGIEGFKVKTIFQHNLPIETLLNDTGWLDSEQLYLHNQVNFADANLGAPVNRYQMFTFARCGTVFTESVLQKKYCSVEHHYVLENDLTRIVKECQPIETLICLLYRRDWWGWLVSNVISEHNDYYHYNSKINFAELNLVEITQEHIDLYEERIRSIFNFWCNLRMCLPMHQFKLFEFAEVIRQNQKSTNHKKIPYTPADFVYEHKKVKQAFDEKVLPCWQELERKCLYHLSAMKVNPTSII